MFSFFFYFVYSLNIKFSFFPNVFCSFFRNISKLGLSITCMCFYFKPNLKFIFWFPYILSAAVVLFAFSTMISWSYYGERCWAWLFGDGSSMVYRCLFLLMVFLGSIITSTNVLDFGDLMILGMAFPNVLGLYFLAGGVKSDLNDYLDKLKKGEFEKNQ